MEVSPTTAARLVDKSRETVRRWVRSNLLPCREEGLRGDIKIDLNELREFAKKYGYRFDEELAGQLK